ncbi:zinc finger, CCHC-type containing LTR copia-type gag-polypeptide [Tanacetum coccineum]
MRFVDGSYPAPSKTVTVDGKETQNSEYLSLVKTDQKVLLILQSSLSEEAMAEVLGLTSSRAVWLALESAYSHDSLERSQNLKDWLRQLKKGNLSVSSLILLKSLNHFVISLQPSANQSPTWTKAIGFCVLLKLKVTSYLYRHSMVLLLPLLHLLSNILRSPLVEGVDLDAPTIEEILPMVAVDDHLIANYVD